MSFGTSLADVAIQHKPTYSIYLSLINDKIVRLDENGTYLQQSTTTRPFLCIDVADNGNVYSLDNNGGANMYKLSANLATSSVISVDATYVDNQKNLRYSSYNNLLYEIDTSGRNWINAFDLNLNRQPQYSIKQVLSNPNSIGFYNKDSKNLLYVGLGDGSIQVYDQNLLSKRNSIAKVCSSYYPFDILVDSTNDYMVVICYFDDFLYLWTTDGDTHTNTKMKLAVISPQGMDYDDYGRLYVALESKLVIYE